MQVWNGKELQLAGVRLVILNGHLPHGDMDYTPLLLVIWNEPAPYKMGICTFPDLCADKE